MKVVTSAQMRELEAGSAALGLPGPALMEIAGRALADECARLAVNGFGNGFHGSPACKPSAAPSCGSFER